MAWPARCVSLSNRRSEKMCTRTTLTVAGLLVLAVAASAQNPGPGRGRGGFGPAAGDAAAPGGARFLGAEAGMPGRVVKNAPYSADIVTETTQTLIDGNHIRQSSTAKVYRDTEGRTRREQSLNALGGPAPRPQFAAGGINKGSGGGLQFRSEPPEPAGDGVRLGSAGRGRP